MDSNPPKRRRTSHTTSLRVHAPSTPSPQKPRRDGTRTTPRRASFLSPTKASLARFNPELLARPQSAGSGTRRLRLRGDPTAGFAKRLLSPPKSSLSGESQRGADVSSQIARASQVGDDAIHHAILQQRTPDPSMETETPPPLPEPTSTSGQEAPTPNQMQVLARLVSRSQSLGKTAPAVRMIPSARAKAPTASKKVVAATRRSARLSQGYGEDGSTSAAEMPVEDGEPDLPPTPMDLGVHDPTMSRTPSGLHSTSASRQRRERGARQTANSSTPVRKSRSTDATNIGATGVEDKVDNSDGDEDRAVDVLLKEELKSQLLLELRQLEDEVRGLESQLAKAKDTDIPVPEKPPDGRDGDTAGTPTSASLIARPAMLIVQASHISWGRFLPFSKRRKVTPKTSTLPIPDGPPPSHHPIELENPLPYLQAFTPLTFLPAHKLSPLRPPIAKSNQASQQHAFTVASPQQLFSATVVMTVDTDTHSITTLSITRLSPWAERELGKWIRARAESSDVGGKDVSSICWAMGRYWEMAQKRARFWIRCQECFPELVSTRARRGQQHAADEDGDVSGEEGPPTSPGGGQTRTIKLFDRCNVSRHLGRSNMMFQRRDVRLLIAWDISLDWTGEGQSHVSATASVPPAWTRADTRASLGKTSKLFRDLVRQKGMYVAMRIVVGLLFPEQ